MQHTELHLLLFYSVKACSTQNYIYYCFKVLMHMPIYYDVWNKRTAFWAQSKFFCYVFRFPRQVSFKWQSCGFLQLWNLDDRQLRKLLLSLSQALWNCLNGTEVNVSVLLMTEIRPPAGFLQAKIWYCNICWRWWRKVWLRTRLHIQTVEFTSPRA